MSAAHWASVALYISLGAAVLSVLTMVMQCFTAIDMEDGVFETSRVEMNDAIVQAGGIFELAALVHCVIAFSVWINKTHQFLVKKAPLPYGRNAWGWFFVPIANLFVPFRVVKSYWTARTGEAVVPWVFPTWWGLWIAYNIFARVSQQMFKTVDDAGSLLSASIVEALVSMVGVAAAFFAIRVVRMISTPATSQADPALV